MHSKFRLGGFHSTLPMAFKLLSTPTLFALQLRFTYVTYYSTCSMLCNAFLLFLFLFILFVCLFVYLFICLFVCLFIYLFIYLFIKGGCCTVCFSSLSSEQTPNQHHPMAQNMKYITVTEKNNNT